MECFEPPAEPQQLIARLDVVARHSTPALYNAVEHRRIPGRMVWMPLAKVQEGIGGKTKAISAVAVALLSLLGAAFYFVPYQLKMETNGKLVPWVRRVIYPPTTGTIKEFKVEPGDVVAPDRAVGHHALDRAGQKLSTMFLAFDRRQRGEAPGGNQCQFQRAAQRRTQLPRQGRDPKENRRGEEKRIRRVCRAQPCVARSFQVGRIRSARASVHHRGERRASAGKNGRSSTATSRTNGATARPGLPMRVLRLGAKDGPWEIELRIPQKHISQVLRAYERNGGQALDVDFLLRSDPTRTLPRQAAIATKSPARPCPTAMRKTNRSRRSSPSSASTIRHRSGLSSVARVADQRHRGPRQDPLRQASPGLCPVLRGLGIRLRENRVLLLRVRCQCRLRR